MTAHEIQLLNGKLYEECISYALTLTNSVTAAQDVVQEAYYRAFKNQVKFEPGSNLRAWIKRIVYNTFISDYRQDKRRKELYAQGPRVNHWSKDSTTANPAPTDLEAGELRDMIDQLKDIYRRPFLLYLHGMQYDQISRSFNVPIGTVKSRVFVARRQLRQIVTDHYATAEAHG